MSFAITNTPRKDLIMARTALSQRFLMCKEHPWLDWLQILKIEFDKCREKPLQNILLKEHSEKVKKETQKKYFQKRGEHQTKLGAAASLSTNFFDTITCCSKLNMVEISPLKLL